MGYTVNSIVINKEINEVFLIINNVENWPELHGYQNAEVLDKRKLVDGKLKIVFRVTGNEEENTGEGEKHPEIWVSQRIIDFSSYSARGVRLEPMYPFKHWILDVLLSEEEEGTRMTWVQDFSMDEESGLTEETVEEMINCGSKEELQIFKSKIESGTVYKRFEL